MADLNAIRFEYRVVQLNQLNWRDFLSNPNPAASALMAKMNVSEKDRPRVKVACLRMLVKLKLSKAKQDLISTFVDNYLDLTPSEEMVFAIVKPPPT